MNNVFREGSSADSPSSSFLFVFIIPSFQKQLADIFFNNSEEQINKGMNSDT